VTDKNGNKELNILLEKFKNGDQSAFEEIYKRCYGHIAFVCSKLCENKEDVEEVLQDTFMAIFKKADKLRGDTFLALVRKIAIDECYDKRRKNKSEYFVYSDEMVETADLDEDFLPERYLQNKESQAELVQIINNLPPKQREMIYLYYYVGISTIEIARLNNCTTVNVRTILHKARNAIKRKIEGQSDYIQGMSSVSLAAILFMEAEVFAAGYVNVGTVGIMGVVGKATGTSAKASSAFAIAASVVIVGVISIAAYIIASPNTEIDEVQEPPITLSTPVPTPTIENYIEESISIQHESEEIHESSPIYEIPETPEYTPEIEEVEHDINYMDEAEDLPLEEIPEEDEPPPLPDELGEPNEPDELESAEEPEPPEEPEEADEPYEPEPEPTPIDRTPEILEALAIATHREEVDWIIYYYGFSLITQMQHFTGQRFWFYELDDGSGAIVIGIAEYEDGIQWRMKFEHYDNSQRPSDRMMLFRWMEAGE